MSSEHRSMWAVDVGRACFVALHMRRGCTGWDPTLAMLRRAAGVGFQALALSVKNTCSVTHRFSGTAHYCPSKAGVPQEGVCTMHVSASPHLLGKNTVLDRYLKGALLQNSVEAGIREWQVQHVGNLRWQSCMS